ncbi:DUF881 domain-containing protein [Georgenia alba]|uniref:DUF881 domain-containing protein n=1 Tax=Georgenia alba TaxID=2233858 RepID=A0ABW2QG65_9MICO
MTPAGRPEQDTVRTARPDESMSLLRYLLENPLDAGYRRAAEQRPTRPRRRSWWQKAVVLVLSIAIGTGGVWAARELRAPQGGLTPARSLLLEQIEERTAAGHELEGQNATISAEIESLEQAGLGLVDDDLAAQLDALAVPSGAVAVSGPGVVVRLEDSPAAQQGAEGSEDERITDVDLQVLVNSLWAAGAEAVSINGTRLGSTTAIRTAGEAVLVNLEPVVSPYQVEAIGEPDHLQTELARTPAATHLDVLRSTYSISVDISTQERIEMAALSGVAPRYAQPLGDVAPTSSGVSPSGDRSADSGADGEER